MWKTAFKNWSVMVCLGTDFTWSVLEYFFPTVLSCIFLKIKFLFLMLAYYIPSVMEKESFPWISLCPINCQCCPHMETSQVICTANQLTGVYMRATLAINGLKSNSLFPTCFRNVLLYGSEIWPMSQKDWPCLINMW